MCGRFCIAASPGELAERYQIFIPRTYIQRYNVAPGEEILIITSTAAGRTASFGRWGFSTRYKTRIINARIESIYEKELFLSQVDSGRCIIPVSGFYEWSQESQKKKPWYIFSKHDLILSLAGLKRTVNGHDEIVILTMKAEGNTRQIHSRIPVILSHEGEIPFLSGEIPTSIQRYDTRFLEMHQVSSRVNKPGPDNPELIRPVATDIQSTFDMSE